MGRPRSDFSERTGIDTIVLSEYLFYNVDGYDTPEDNRCSWGYRLCLGCRLYYYAGIFGTFVSGGVLGARGKLDAGAQTRRSNRNLRLIEKCGGRVHIAGLEHLRACAGKPTVVVANHMSLLETGLLHSLMRGYLDFSFVVKESLMHVPFFRHVIRSLDVIPVSRTNPREDLKTMLREGKRILDSGRSLLVFPQSTRMETVDPERFNSIGVKLARASNVPVLPLALKTGFIANGRLVRDLGPIRPERRVCFEFAPAMEVEGTGQAQQHAIVEFINSRLAEWRKQDGDAKR